MKIKDFVKYAGVGLLVLKLSAPAFLEANHCAPGENRVRNDLARKLDSGYYQGYNGSRNYTEVFISFDRGIEGDDIRAFYQAGGQLGKIDNRANLIYGWLPPNVIKDFSCREGVHLISPRGY